MTKSELIEKLITQKSAVPPHMVDDAVREILEYISNALVSNKRVEVRGFGSFSLHYRSPRIGRNPKTGDKVDLGCKYVPYFKTGKELRERVNACRSD